MKKKNFDFVLFFCIAAFISIAVLFVTKGKAALTGGKEEITKQLSLEFPRAYITVNKKPYAFNEKEAELVLMQILNMEANWLVDHLPKTIVENNDIRIDERHLCALDFKFSNSGVLFHFPIYKNAKGNVLTVVKKVHSGGWFVYDGQYDAKALLDKVNDMTYGMCTQKNG